MPAGSSPARAPAWHAGELAVQRRLGARGGDEGRPALRRDVPPAAVEFLEAQHVVVVTASTAPADRGAVWTTALTGEPGFVTAGEDRVTIEARSRPDDPLAATLVEPALVGLLAIEPATRRRMRINGRSRPTARGLVIEPDQVVSNCPKHIVRRSPPIGSAPADDSAPVVRRRSLSDDQIRLIDAADTFFIGTADEHGNADSSHRGGEPGFVEVLAPDRLRVPDFAGNRMYLTLGNLELRPDVGLLFVDWTTGTTLQLTGRARVDYDAPVTRTPTGREITIEIAEVAQSIAPRLAGWWELDGSGSTGAA